jgi:type II secretory pathway pseudopilin PulG
MKPTQHLAARIRLHAEFGFTLIEVVIMIVLTGVISIIATPKMLNNPAITLGSQVKQFAADLRRAQLLATVTGSSVCVSASGQNYYVYQCAQPLSKIIDPSTGKALDVSFKNSLNFTNPAIVPALAFNSLGQPNHATSYTIAPTKGTASLTVNVTALTGYISTNATP